jgi:hypothetical protein
LKDRLSEDSVFLEFVPYRNFDPSGGDEPEPGFVAFVKARGLPVRMIPLGPAAPIDDRVAQWRKDISEGFRNDEVRAELRRLVWAPVAQHFPKQATKVRIVADGWLTALPWPALPGRSTNEVRCCARKCFWRTAHHRQRRLPDYR